jgi:hypothetical protein
MTSKKICDYSGYSCNCAGYVAATGSLCVCGHQRSQHNSTLPILDITQVTQCPDYDSDCHGMSLDQVLACMDYDGPWLTVMCVEQLE